MSLVLAVIGAHPGAGTSGVTLAVADAAARLGASTMLVDLSDPARSGLAGVTDLEGALVAHRPLRWPVRASRRGQIAVRRLAAGLRPAALADLPSRDCWLEHLVGSPDVVVVDTGWDPWPALGGPVDPIAEWLVAEDTWSAMVVRTTVPSVRLAAGALDRIDVIGASLDGVVAVNDPAPAGQEAGWPREVLAAAPTALRRLAPSTVFLPWSPEHARTGWTTSSLPRPLLRAGESLLHAAGLPDAQLRLDDSDRTVPVAKRRWPGTRRHRIAEV